MADSKFETLKEEDIAELLNHRDSKKMEIPFIFKFPMFELKIAVKIIIVCCQLCNLLQNSLKYILSLKLLKCFE